MGKTFEQAQAAYDAMTEEDLRPEAFPILFEEEDDDDDEPYDWDGANGWQPDIND